MNTCSEHHLYTIIKHKDNHNLINNFVNTNYKATLSTCVWSKDKECLYLYIVQSKERINQKRLHWKTKWKCESCTIKLFKKNIYRHWMKRKKVNLFAVSSGKHITTLFSSVVILLMSCPSRLNTFIHLHINICRKKRLTITIAPAVAISQHSSSKSTKTLLRVQKLTSHWLPTDYFTILMQSDALIQHSNWRGRLVAKYLTSFCKSVWHLPFHVIYTLFVNKTLWKKGYIWIIYFLAFMHYIKKLENKNCQLMSYEFNLKKVHSWQNDAPGTDQQLTEALLKNYM